jgi:hypothetical protein
MKQGQRLNLKWTVGDIDKLVIAARQGKSVFDICAALKGSRLDSSPDEILKLIHEAGGQFARRA